MQFAAANMTGSNRLLLGLGWSSVVLRQPVRRQPAQREDGQGAGARVRLPPRARLPAIAGLVAFVIPVTGEIHLVLGILLLAFFAYYLYRAAPPSTTHEPDLIGPAATIGGLPTVQRRTR